MQPAAASQGPACLQSRGEVAARSTEGSEVKSCSRERHLDPSAPPVLLTLLMLSPRAWSGGCFLNTTSLFIHSLRCWVPEFKAFRRLNFWQGGYGWLPPLCCPIYRSKFEPWDGQAPRQERECLLVTVQIETCKRGPRQTIRTSTRMNSLRH